MVHILPTRYVVLIFSLANYANSIGLTGSQAALISALCRCKVQHISLPHNHPLIQR